MPHKLTAAWGQNAAKQHLELFRHAFDFFFCNLLESNHFLWSARPVVSLANCCTFGYKTRLFSLIYYQSVLLCSVKSRVSLKSHYWSLADDFLWKHINSFSRASCFRVSDYSNCYSLCEISVSATFGNFPKILQILLEIIVLLRSYSFECSHRIRQSVLCMIKYFGKSPTFYRNAAMARSFFVIRRT